SACCRVTIRSGVTASVSRRQTKVQVPAERMRNSTGFAPSRSYRPSTIQRATGTSPSTNSPPLKARTGTPAMRKAGRSADRLRAGMTVGTGSSVMDTQIHALIEVSDLVGIAVEHERGPLRLKETVDADAPFGGLAPARMIDPGI